ncbi:hypothetical protein [Pedobacter glucosidilyticus]|uniref:hypothetical protein n=1 Tax=Pedobacter glucosidilyticus TaxID=1122941 RepID=UPI00047B88E7|nr:hypothetical protein [Pedobacter glucosidilyticus]
MKNTIIMLILSLIIFSCKKDNLAIPSSKQESYKIESNQFNATLIKLKDTQDLNLVLNAKDSLLYKEVKVLNEYYHFYFKVYSKSTGESVLLHGNINEDSKKLTYYTYFVKE